MLDAPPWPFIVGSSVALGGGLLIGLERERRKQDEPQLANAAGVRSFSLAALAGAWAQGIGEPLLTAAGFIALAWLAGIALLRRRGETPAVLTSWALCLTYLLGVLSMAMPLGGAAGAVIIAGVLYERERLHRFATTVLRHEELHDALVLGALILVLLPLLPSQPIAWLGGLQPRAVGVLMVLILLMQAAGHIALRLAGARLGLALSGFASGFVSSTATIASMGAQARAIPAQGAAYQLGACLSTVATWVQAILMLVVLSPALAAQALPALGTGALAALVSSAAIWRRGVRGEQGPPPVPTGGVLRLQEAVWVVCVLSLVTMAVSWARTRWGDAGALAGAVLSGFGDAQSSIAAFAMLVDHEHLPVATATAGVLASISANSVTRSVTAFVSGGRQFGARLSASLAGAAACSWGAWWWLGRGLAG